MSRRISPDLSGKIGESGLFLRENQLFPVVSPFFPHCWLACSWNLPDFSSTKVRQPGIFQPFSIFSNTKQTHARTFSRQKQQRAGISRFGAINLAKELVEKRTVAGEWLE